MLKNSYCLFKTLQMEYLERQGSIAGTFKIDALRKLLPFGHVVFVPLAISS